MSNTITTKTCSKYGREYRVIEDNGGGIHLYVWTRAGTMIYSNSGYEVDPTDLASCLDCLRRGDGPDWWDNNALDSGGDNDYDYLLSQQSNGGATIICDNGEWYPDDCGAAGKQCYNACKPKK
jgi:hypothetical protein